ncbi:MAG: hypothetical protein WAW37_06870 [Syntrophobacteraceae bacterium]
MSEKERKIEEINSFLSFVMADLEDASPEDRRKWAGFLFRTMGPLVAILPFREPTEWPAFPDDEEWKFVKSIQEAWNIALTWLLACVDNLEKTVVAAVYYNVPRYFTWGMAKDSMFINRIHPSSEANMLTARIYDGEVLNNIDFYSDIPDNLPYYERQFPPGFISFMEALSGFPRKSLKRCLHCDRMFFTPTNLRKRYCSSHCQKIASVYRSRLKQKNSE